MKTVKWLDRHMEEVLLCILLVFIACVELMQVIFRNVAFITSLTWAEEFCRFCWIWTVFLSLPYTIRNGSMLRVNLLSDLLKKRPAAKKTVNIAVEIINTAVMTLLAVNSTGVVSSIRESGEASPAMLWPMWLVYAVLFIGFTLGAARGLQRVILLARKGGEN